MAREDKGIAMISFIMMAKNVESFVDDAIKSLQREKNKEWELIFVDDGSTDRTYSIAYKHASIDARIKVFRNPFTGKVNGTSFAYTKTSGEVIKCIDSDDILLPNFFEFTEQHNQYDVLFHSCKIVDENLDLITTYHPNSTWMRTDFQYVAENMVSFPKWTWSFRREVAEKVFPLPESLPFEDVWISLMCKKHSVNPGFTREALYLYRQHREQTYGGILNFSRPATIFRAERLLKLITVLEGEERLQHDAINIDFSKIKKENRYLAGHSKLTSTIFEPLSFKRSVRLLLTGRAPNLLASLAIRQWRKEAKYLG